MDGKYSEFLQSLEAATPAPKAPAVSGKYGTLLQELDSKLNMTPVPEGLKAEEPAVAPVDFSKKTYSENDLLSDEFFVPIKDYMVDRFGTHIEDIDKEEIVSMFVNNMRGFSGGNTVRAINEITYLNEVGEDEERLSKAGKAYEIFENLQPLMTGETTWGEALSGSLDYARSAVLDPANLLGLGLGKTATGVGFKAGSQVALIAAKQAYKKQLAKGATKEVADKVASRILRMQTSKVVAETNKQIAARQAAEKAATTFLQRMSTPTAIKEAAIVGGFEGAIAAGTDYLYQDAMLRTKVQEEYNTFQTGLSAVVGLVAGGLSGAAGNVGTGASGLLPPAPLKTSTKGSTALSKLTAQMTAAVPEGVAPTTDIVPGGSTWLRDVARGKELTDQDNEFFFTMLLGNDEKGLKGLAQILVEDGYVWKKRTPDDKVSNWVGDIIKYADPQDAKQFLDDFSAATGIKMVEGKALTIEAFADTFKKKMSDSGRVLSAASRVSKILGRDPRSLTIGDYADFVLGGGVPEAETALGGIVEGASKALGNNKIGNVVKNLVNRDLPDFQNNIIRLMVSNLSTTALNVTGYAASTGLNSATDVARAVLLGGKAGIFMAFKPKEAKKFGIDAMGLLQNQITKAKNTLDPNATYETFLQYAQTRPEAMRQLTSVLPGGVESLEKLAKGVDLSTPMSTLKINQAVDIIQRLSLVSAQDGYTKAIEFTSQMDKLLRRSPEDGGYGMSWKDFFSQPDHHSKMVSERFVTLEAQAVDETLRSVFSKSFKGKHFLGEVAGMIEDARNLPGIGLLVPFGRFFNNTVAFAYQTTAFGPLLSKSMGLGDQTKPTSELVARGLVTWSLIGIMTQREMDYIEKGLAWSEEIDENTGEVLDERYEFPYGAYKAIARYFAHELRGDEVPTELTAQFGDQFVGQLTRQLGEAGQGLGGIVSAILSDEGPGMAKVLGDALGTIVPQAISGATRPLEPLNVIAGLSRDEEFYVPDRKQGTEWYNNSIRYMDQAIALVTGENAAPPKESAAEGRPRVQASKLISTTRGSKLTNTERVMNEIGKPTFLANMASQSEAADNRYNEIFHEIVEDQAGVLFNSKTFRKGSLEFKQSQVKRMLTAARKTTLDYMGRVASNSNDRALLKMINISKGNPKLQIQRVLDDLGFDRDLSKLSEEELDTLSNALKFREEFLGSSNK